MIAESQARDRHMPPHTHCHAHAAASDLPPPRWRRALWIALLVNAAMFALELAGGLSSGSAALLADALDFAGDAANYGLSLAVLGLGSAWRSRAALVKGLSMALWGLLVLARVVWGMAEGRPPEALTMGAVGLLALAANLGVAALLYRWRGGGADMRSVWLCARNDALGNLAVMAAALGVFGTGRAWPDLAVAAVMAVLAMLSGRTVVRLARQELAR